MKIGDLVRVNESCDARGLWGKMGVIIKLPDSLTDADRVFQAWVMLPDQIHIINSYDLDVIHESR